MALRYPGDPIRVDTSAEAASMLAHTATLPDRNIQGALIRFAVEVGGNMLWVHYQVIGRRPLILRRVIGFAGDDEKIDVPDHLIRSMNGHDVRFMVDQVKLVYRNHPLLASSRRKTPQLRKPVECAQA